MSDSPQAKPKDEPVIDWNPAPGYVLCKSLRREEVAAIYNKPSNKPGLSLPDNVGKVSDSVGIGRVIKAAPPTVDDALKIEKYHAAATKAEKDKALSMFKHGIEVGDYVAFMPFTDALIEIDGVKYSLVGYDKIRAVRKGGE